MEDDTLIGLIVIIVVSFTLFTFLSVMEKFKTPGIDTRSISKIVTDNELEKYNSNMERIWAFIGKDLSKKYVVSVY